jgi:hypothetical protein
MDETRFDAFARSMQTASPRRVALGLLLGSALGLTELADGDAKKKGKKGKGKKGKKDKGKKGCEQFGKSCNAKCGRGKECCFDFDCDDCQNLYCNGAGEGQAGTCGCPDDMIYHNGRCGVMPTCLSAGEVRPIGGTRCCSGSEDPDTHICEPGYLSCLADIDCVAQPCRGFTCEAPTLFCNLR